MTVGELIYELAKYPMDMKVGYINTVSKTVYGELSLFHKDTAQEIEEGKRRKEELDKENQERMDRVGEITSFVNRW